MRTKQRKEFGIFWFIFMVALIIIAFSCNAHASSNVVIETILLEARGEGSKGMIAVSEVIRERIRRRGMLAEQVVMQPWQFSCNNKDKKTQEWRRRALAKMTLADYRLASQAWAESKFSNITKGADLYHANYVKPKWNWSHTVKTVTIGKHLFYREV